ncbi:Interferon- developmental regulator 1 [Coemansia sp. RSA 2607]|nr:Interferon- developmental regulator 1 [Coemansia sp. RSA 2607]KAJ2383944.1 Interferon- developmental regulator 1 [Coemansia sp. RSA 2603]
MDSLGEKRAVTREKALSTIVRIMSLRYLGDELAGSRISLLEALKRSARSTKSEKESMLGLLALGQWFVNFGMDEGDEYAGVESMLRTLVSDHKSPSVRAVALNILGIANFVAAVDFNDAADVMRFVSERFFAPSAASAPASLLRQALETYGLLLTVLIDGNMQLAEHTFNRVFAAHMRALAADAVDVRVAAAQNFALMHEALGGDELDRQEELVATLRAIKQESAKRHGKRDTHAQRSAMRDVLRSLEDGDAPQMRLVLGGRSVAFDRWQRIVRLHSFRTCLGGGLPTHFVENPLLQDVFDVHFDRAGESQADVARVVVSPKSELAKLRTKDMRKKRSAHNAQQAAFDFE